MNLNHAMVEVKLGEKWLLADPLNGWIYNKSIVELINLVELPINYKFAGRKGHEVYKSDIFFKNIYYVEAYEDLAYTGLFSPEKNNWRYDLINTYTTNEGIFNPNAFHYNSEGGLFLIDLSTGVLKLTEGIVTNLEIDQDVSFRLPAAIAEYENKLYVADYRNNRVVILNSQSYDYMGEFTNLLMSDPEGIACDKNGNVYVASYGNGYILKFDSDGELVGSWNTSSKDNLLVHPHGLFISDNEVYVTELSGTPSVIVYDLNGKYLRSFGYNLDKEYSLKYPTTVWVSGDNVYVADAVAHQIKIFDRKGEFEKSIGEFGIGKGQFYYPYAVAVDTDGTIVVGDTHNHRIQRFKANGDYMYSIVREGEELALDEQKHEVVGELSGVKMKELKVSADDLEIDSNSNLYLLRSSSGVIDKYDLQQNSSTQVIKDLVYPWSIKLSNNQIVILDEPGSMNYYNKSGLMDLYMGLTTQQFDPTSSIETFIYRPQNFDISEEKIAIANTLPGNVVITSPYGDIQKLIKLSNDINTRSMPTSVTFTEKDELIICDMFNNSVFKVNLQTDITHQIISPIGFYKPYDVSYSGEGDFIVVSEPEINRLQIFDSNYRYIGCLTDKMYKNINKPLRLDIDKSGILYVSTPSSVVIIENLNDIIKEKKVFTNSLQLEEKTAFIESINNFEGTESLFLKMYEGVSDKAKNYWDYYKDSNGIVKYDFNFSFLNFQVPVSPGYGAHTWVTGVAHKALLSYYRWQETGDESEKRDFINHAKWLYDNVIVEQDKIYWLNNIKINREDAITPFISSTSQASSAAVLIKAAKHVDEETSLKYMDVAINALNVLGKMNEDGGTLEILGNGDDFYTEYNVGEGILYDIQPFVWTLVFLSECEGYEQKLFENGMETFNHIYENPIKVIDENKYWSEILDENNTTISIITSKFIDKFNSIANAKKTMDN